MKTKNYKFYTIFICAFLFLINLSSTDNYSFNLSNFKKSLSKYRLKKPIKKLYKVPSYNSLIDWTDELSNLETYNYYDRIITFVPKDE